MNAGDSSAFVLPDFVRMRDFAIRDVRATQCRFRDRRLAPIRSTPAVALVLPVRAETHRRRPGPRPARESGRMRAHRARALATAMPLPSDSTPRRAPDLEVREVPDGFVVYDPVRDRLHFLNGSAAFVLECCDGATRVEELPALLGAAFHLDANPFDEVEACLTRLTAEGLVTVDVEPQAGGR